MLETMGLARSYSAGDSALEQAILQAIAYGDIFDYPLCAAEIHRYLVGLPATVDAVAALLDSGGSPLVRAVTRSQGYFMLASREGIVETRKRRQGASAEMWAKALPYGRLMSSIPFVRMVSVTGALAVDNVEAGDDIDFLIVAAAGRLWICRALVTALARLASRRGDALCPNYVLSERALALADRDLHTAHELAQMVPISGCDVYRRMRELNGWTSDFLPNAEGPPRPIPLEDGTRRGILGALGEKALGGRLGAWADRRLGRWQAARLRRKMARRELGSAEVDFGTDSFKGHFDGNGQRILDAHVERIRRVEAILG